MLYIVPIESYDRRYSEQWNRWFPEYLKSIAIPHRIIWGQDTTRILDESDVLDTFGTHLYKYSQLYQIVNLIRAQEITAKDVILFHTLWFTGIDSLQYIRQCLGIDFKITGVLHAGSYDPWDFRTRLGMKPWALHLERAWLTFVDKVFVASEFHKQLLLESIDLDPTKVVVTRLPLKISEIKEKRGNTQKEDIVAFPHRIVPEKDPDLVNRLRERLPGIKIVRTQDICKTKKEFYDLLARCKVCISNSFQETFGYSMLESVVLGCIPLVPDRLCYKEMYPDEFRFLNEDGLIAKISYFLNNWFNPSPMMGKLLRECDHAIAAMVEQALDNKGSYSA